MVVKFEAKDASEVKGRIEINHNSWIEFGYNAYGCACTFVRIQKILTNIGYSDLEVVTNMVPDFMEENTANEHRMAVNFIDRLIATYSVNMEVIEPEDDEPISQEEMGLFASQMVDGVLIMR